MNHSSSRESQLAEGNADNTHSGRRSSNRWFVCPRVLQVWEKDRSPHTSGAEDVGDTLFTRQSLFALVVDTVRPPSSEIQVEQKKPLHGK